MGASAMKQRRGGLGWMLLGILVSVVCVVLGAMTVPWPEVYDSFLHLNWSWAALGAVLFIASYVLFARRWRATLLRQVRLPTTLMLGYLLIGYMLNSIFPLRAGDVARAAILRTRHDIKTGVAVASVVIERLLDVLIVVGIGVFTAFFFDLPHVVRTSLMIFATACAVGVVGLTVLAMEVPLTKGVRARITDVTPRAFAPLIDRYLRPFLAGFRIFHSFVDVLRVCFWSAAGWVVFLLGMYCFVQSLGLDLPWTAAAVVVVTTGLGAAIPSSPGALGVYHALAVFALSLYQVATPTAVAFAVVVHATSMLLHIGLGAVCSLTLGINALQASRNVGEEVPDISPDVSGEAHGGAATNVRN